MEIQKIKIHQALTCNESDSVKEVAKKLKENKDRRAFVIKDKKLIGITTTTDLVYNALAQDNFDLSVKDVMTSEIKHIDIKDNLENALEVMHQTKSYVCPVTKDNEFLGIISYHDLVTHVANSIE